MLMSVNPIVKKRGALPFSEVIHRGVESGEILADTLNDVGGPKGQNRAALVPLCG
jgi:hypothetical protein